MGLQIWVSGGCRRWDLNPRPSTPSAFGQSYEQPLSLLSYAGWELGCCRGWERVVWMRLLLASRRGVRVDLGSLAGELVALTGCNSGGRSQSKWPRRLPGFRRSLSQRRTRRRWSWRRWSRLGSRCPTGTWRGSAFRRTGQGRPSRLAPCKNPLAFFPSSSEDEFRRFSWDL